MEACRCSSPASGDSMTVPSDRSIAPWPPLTHVSIGLWGAGAAAGWGAAPPAALDERDGEAFRRFGEGRFAGGRGGEDFPPTPSSVVWRCGVWLLLLGTLGGSPRLCDALAGIGTTVMDCASFDSTGDGVGARDASREREATKAIDDEEDELPGELIGRRTIYQCIICVGVVADKAARM